MKRMLLFSLLLCLLAPALQAQSMQFKEIFQPHLQGQFRGLKLGMTFAEANNVAGITREPLYDNPNVMFSYPISRYGMEGDKLDGYYLFTQDETLREIMLRISLVDDLNLSDMDQEVREYLDYEYGSGSKWGNETRWQQGATRITLNTEDEGSGGMLLLKFTLNRN